MVFKPICKEFNRKIKNSNLFANTQRSCALVKNCTSFFNHVARAVFLRVVLVTIAGTSCGHAAVPPHIVCTTVGSAVQSRRCTLVVGNPYQHHNKHRSVLCWVLALPMLVMCCLWPPPAVVCRSSSPEPTVPRCSSQFFSLSSSLSFFLSWSLF